MSNRAPLKVSGLIQQGRVKVDANAAQRTDFGAATGAQQSPSPANGPIKIGLSFIDDSPYQPRLSYDPVQLTELASSMSAAGLNEPIKVRQKANSRYELIAGHRRVRSARINGWADIDSYVLDLTDAAAQRAAMMDNEGRVDLTDYERGKLYQHAVDLGLAKTQAEIALYFGTSQARVSRCLGMLALPQPFTALLDEKPDAFTFACAADIKELLKAHPNEQDLIVQAAERVAKGDADQKGITAWVAQMVKQRHQAPAQEERAVITSSQGRPMFSARTRGREISVRIQTAEIDVEEAKKVMLDALREYTQSLEQNSRSES